MRAYSSASQWLYNRKWKWNTQVFFFSLLWLHSLLTLYVVTQIRLRRPDTYSDHILCHYSQAGRLCECCLRGLLLLFFGVSVSKVTAADRSHRHSSVSTTNNNRFSPYQTRSTSHSHACLTLRATKEYCEQQRFPQSTYVSMAFIVAWATHHRPTNACIRFTLRYNFLKATCCSLSSRCWCCCVVQWTRAATA